MRSYGNIRNDPIMGVSIKEPVNKPLAGRRRFRSRGCAKATNRMVDPLRKELDKADWLQNPPRTVRGKTGAPGVALLGHRRPNYDLRRAPCDHPNFAPNAAHRGLVRGFLLAGAIIFGAPGGVYAAGGGNKPGNMEI